MPTDYDVVVVGGGVIGCGTARELAPDHDVLVVEKGQIAAEASALAAGEVTMTPSYTDHPEVAEHALSFFRAYDGTGEFEYHESESYELVTAGNAELARRRVAREQEDGIDIEFVPAAEADVPRLRTDELDGFVHYDETGFVDPYTFSVTLKEDAEREGATFLTETPVHDVLVEDGAVTGVDTAQGQFTADHVVVAAGWRSQQFLAGTVEIPVQPYRTQILILEPDDPLPREFPMGWIPGEHVYFRPELNGDLLVGGWSFAEDDPEGASGQADEEFRQHVAGLLPRFFEGFDTAGFVNGWAGIDGATPDTRPIVDSVGPDGLVVATGFNGRGIMTTPVAVTLVRSLVTGEETALPREAFAIDRFDSTSPDFEFISISSGGYE